MERKTKKCKICNQEIEVDDGYLCSTCRKIDDEVKLLEEGLNIIFPVFIKTARKIKLNWQYTSSNNSTFSPEDLKEEDIPTVEDEDTL